MTKLLLNLAARGLLIFTLVYLFSSIVPVVTLKTSSKFLIALLVTLIYIILEYIAFTLKIKHVYYLHHHNHRHNHNHNHHKKKPVHLKEAKPVLNKAPTPANLPPGSNGAERLPMESSNLNSNLNIQLPSEPQAAGNEGFENFSYL
jgi:hypothetical protein